MTVINLTVGYGGCLFRVNHLATHYHWQKTVLWTYFAYKCEQEEDWILGVRSLRRVRCSGCATQAFAWSTAFVNGVVTHLLPLYLWV